MLTSEDAPPFLCFCCSRAQKVEEVARLQSVVELLKNLSKCHNRMSTGPSSEQVTKESSKFSGDYGEQTTRSVRTAPQSGHNSVPTASRDSKFNVVLYGVEECRSGLSRPASL